MEKQPVVGYACAYTPLALIHAAGFVPHRILPDVDCPDQAGRLLHDNLCPHVKRILDRAMSGRLPDMAGMVFMNSCDAMRRLADAWRMARPDVPAVCVDMPATAAERDIFFFQVKLQQLVGVLAEWGGRMPRRDEIAGSLRLYNRLAGDFERVRARVRIGAMREGALLLQQAYLRASCTPPETMHDHLEMLLAREDAEPADDSVPIYLFGNVLPDAEAFALFAACGARIVGEDLCTGSRLFTPIAAGADDGGDPLADYARGLLGRPACARTISATRPAQIAGDIVAAARHHQAKGVIGYTVKFCDPYISRLPVIRAALKDEGMPFLLLEGDCTVRSMGQQKTRIEAFTEMLR
ncbi:MAG: 2-hydroxyacyl-CoA dehydratase subunit D [Thermodesulfobacteriota bacterium]